jgi:hypothetical protein
MQRSADSTDRAPAAYLLFALGFIAVMAAAGGVVLSRLPIATLGLVLLVVVLYSFWIRSGRDQ